jgi:hypothetical protein
MNIPLGYEIGSGKRVAIPVNHTVVLGQTQLSGKTTTLEAMITRSGVRAVGFITKPGEKSFRLERPIPPFFSEATTADYWKYIVAIVENLMSVKLGWQERGWIVKLCQDYKDKTKAKAYSWKRPETLKDLLKNAKTALPYLRGTAEMICMQLEEYLSSVVREIGHTEFSSRLELSTGINVMDVTEMSDGLKALVIRSVIEWVHKHGRKTVVIIPEAWKFIPEGRSTPVKLALEGLIREGAGVGNFVWMDSQDLRGVDKKLLRSVIVWLFGVQRQKNEVANTLANIPDHPKPSATEIMQLGKGEFYVCYETTLVRTYVQPAGMEDAHAQAIARGDESPDSWRQISKALDDQVPDHPQMLQILDQEPADDHIRQEENVTEPGREPDSGDRPDDRGSEGIASANRSESGTPVGREPDQGRDAASGLGVSRVDEAGEIARSRAGEGALATEEDEPMLKTSAPNPTPITERFREYLKLHAVPNDLRDNLVQLLAEFERLVESHDAMAHRLKAWTGEVLSQVTDHESRVTEQLSPSDGVSAPAAGKNRVGEPSSPARTVDGAADGHGALGSAASFNKEKMYILGESTMMDIYDYVRARAEKDPGILEILTRRPEMRVTVERQTLEVNGDTLRGALAVLISKKFFDAPQNGNTAFNELKRLGRAVAKPNVYRELDKLAELGFVTKEETGYQAVPGMKVFIVEDRVSKASAR